MRGKHSVLRTLIQFLSSLAGSAIGIWLSTTGLRDGAVQAFGRHTAGVVSRASHPLEFWLTETGWVFIAGICSWSIFSGAGKLRGRSAWGKAHKQAAPGQKRAAQVRSVEAGTGPEPPWVRFPGSFEDIREDQATAYLANDFLPFWKPLTPEARAAYLTRNPLPNEEWRGVIADLEKNI